MKKMIRIIMSLFIIITVIHHYIFQIQAKEKSQTEFIETVYQSEKYQKYEKKINQLLVNRVSETEEGIRKTISFELESDENEYRTLVFIGNEDNSILDVMLVIDTNEKLSCINLSNNIETNVNYKPYGAVRLCYKMVCSSFAKRPGLHGDNGCSMFIGQACNVAKLLGYPIAAIVCKSGVWFACHFSIDKVCEKFVEYQDVCSL